MFEYSVVLETPVIDANGASRYRVTLCEFPGNGHNEVEVYQAKGYMDAMVMADFWMRNVKTHTGKSCTLINENI